MLYKAEIGKNLFGDGKITHFLGYYSTKDKALDAISKFAKTVYPNKTDGKYMRYVAFEDRTVVDFGHHYVFGSIQKEDLEQPDFPVDVEVEIYVYPEAKDVIQKKSQ